MAPVDLTSHRNAKRLLELHELRLAEDALETARQIQGARQVITEIDMPSSAAEVTMLADALSSR